MKKILTGQLMAEKIYDEIYAFILSQGLMPGDRVKVDDLVRRFGVSQTPVRQALTRLQVEGLLLNVHNRGFIVSPFPSKELLVETLDLRIQFEPNLAAQAAEGNHDDTLDFIDQTFAKLGEHAEIANENIGLLMETDKVFHKTVAHIAPNSVAAEVLDRLHVRNSVFRLKYRRDMPIDVLNEHKDIVGAIRKRSPEQASEAMRDHLAKSIERIHDAL